MPMAEPDGLDVEEIEVQPVPEPETPEEGDLDPADTYREGVDADEAGEAQ